MNYVTIINLIFLIIGVLFSIYLLHFIIFAIVGIFHRKRFPKTEEKCRYGVLVSAKDEENVIPRLINSIRSTDYPQDKLDIYIIAHNCSDRTAEVARNMGATVIVYNNPNAKTLGAAYHYAFPQIDVKAYDGFVILNADNVVKHDYFDKLNDAFVYFEKTKPVTTFRHALNIKDGIMPAMYCYYFSIQCSLSYIGREDLGVSNRVSGCGFLVPVHMLEDGWNYTSITEDIEFSNDKVLNGETIHYCDEAIFYDEQPTKIKTMWFQRLRWAKGQNIISRQFFAKFFKALFSKDHKNKRSLYTSLTFCSFIPLLSFVIFLLQVVLLLLSPLFGVSLQEAFLNWNYEQNWFMNMFMSLNTGFLFGMAKTAATFILSSYVTAIGVLIASRGKYKGQPVLPLIGGFIVLPLFLFLQIPLDICAVFMKEVKWKKIPHGQGSTK